MKPSRVYAKTGWAGIGDWLGSGTIATYLRQYRSFRKARSFVRRLGLESQGEWRDYCTSGKKPPDIPAAPNQIYADDGWGGFGDWLGTGRIRGSGWKPFKGACAFARRLGLKSQREWFKYCKSGNKPADIPANPQNVYAQDGWRGWGNWLGTGAVATYLRQYRSFKKARSFARGLGLKSQSEWKDYCKSGKKPADIPSKPHSGYAKEGWSGFGDWLGTDR